MLQLFTLGRLELVRGTAPAVEVLPVQDKRLAVLAYLAVEGHGRALRRDTVLALFWPDLQTEDGRRALRQALYHLRNVLGDGVLLTAGEELSVNPGGLWCDAAAAATSADNQVVLSLYRGDFLEGFHPARAAPEFDEWLGRTRSQLRQRAVTAARAIARADGDRGAVGSAIVAARRAVELAPADEAAARDLMLLLDKVGDRAGALDAHAALNQTLRETFDAAPSPETDAVAREIRSRHIVHQPLDADPATAVPAPEVVPSQDAGPRRRLRIGLVAVACLAGIGLVAALLNRRAEPGARGLLAVTDRVVVRPFRDHAHDPELAAAVTDLVRIDLMRSSIAVLGPGQVMAAALRMGWSGELNDSVTRELALREGVRAIVDGSIAAVGSGFAVTAEVTVPETGEALLAVRESAGDSVELIRAIDRLGSTLRRRIHGPLGAQERRAPLEQVTTSSLAALRAYSAAERLKVTGQDRVRSLSLLRRAVEADSNFAMAWVGLSNQYAVTGELHLSRVAIQHAWRLRERLPPTERLNATVSYHAYVTGDNHAVASAYRDWLEHDSTDFKTWHNLGLTYQDLHDPVRQVDAAARALRLSDSSISVIWLGLLQGLVNRGSFDDARGTLSAARTRFPDDQYFDHITGYIAQNEFDYGAVERLGEVLAARPEHATVGLRLLADLDQARGRFRRARAHRLRLIEVADAEGSSGKVVSELAAVANSMRLTESPGAARRYYVGEIGRRRLDRLPADQRPFDALVEGYLSLELPVEARRQLEESNAAGLPLGPYFRHYLEAVEAATRGDTAVAAKHLREAIRSDYCPICLMPALGAAWVALGQTDSALTVYRQYLDTPYIHRLEADARHLVPVHLAFARLLEQRGSLDESMTHYRRAIALWDGADSSVAGAIDEARKHAAPLGGVRPSQPGGR